MSQVAFFFDTADVEAIKKIWDKLSKYLDPKSCLGITTNPNALSKVNCHTIDGFVDLVQKMSQTMDQICGQDSLIYVQVPNSCMSIEQITRWAEFISQIDTGKSKIALKIPHFSYVLRQTNTELFKNLYLNVTGISDCGTIIKALGHDQITYASIIPGRMEEVGINANSHLKYLCDQQFEPHQKIITGSMRTILGLKDSVSFGLYLQSAHEFGIFLKKKTVGQHLRIFGVNNTRFPKSLKRTTHLKSLIKTLI